MITPTIPDLAGRLAVTAMVHGDFVLTDGRRLKSYFDEHRLAADPHLPAEADLPKSG
jgi:orotate phosphoribosyltransferase